jgi:hypothetical protein
MGSTSALDAVHGLSTGAKYIAKNGMDLILLLMASRWVQDGFNIGFGCCMMAQDGPKMAPRWPKMAPRCPKTFLIYAQHRLWMLYDGIHMAYDGFIWLKMWPASASEAGKRIPSSPTLYPFTCFLSHANNNSNSSSNSEASERIQMSPSLYPFTCFLSLLYILCLHSIKKNQIYPPHKENLA